MTFKTHIFMIIEFRTHLPDIVNLYSCELKTRNVSMFYQLRLILNALLWSIYLTHLCCGFASRFRWKQVLLFFILKQGLCGFGFWFTGEIELLSVRMLNRWIYQKKTYCKILIDLSLTMTLNDDLDPILT